MFKYDYNDRSVCLFVNIMRLEDKDFRKGSWIELPETFQEKDWVDRVPSANIEIIKDLTNYLYQN